MVSFQVFLHVDNKKYEVLHSDLFMGKAIDGLSRPASPTQGGVFSLELNMPPGNDATLFEWMFSPTKILSGKLVLKRSDLDLTLKTIKFYNAYCVDMGIHFDGTTSTSSFRLTLRVSPEQIDIAGTFHDNKWPEQTPIYDIPPEPETRQPKQEPGLLSDIAHGVLDVVGLIPVAGELADGANALFYLAEGNKTDAAISAAAMIPVAGWVATGAKVVRKGAKIAQKAKGLKKARKALKGAKKVADELDIVIPKKNKIDRTLLDPPKEHGQAPTFKKDGTKVEIHHQGQNRKGPFKEMHWEDHRGKGNDKINHPNKGEPSQVDRGEFNRAKKKYWKKEFPKK